jgi:hypothetical protein
VYSWSEIAIGRLLFFLSYGQVIIAPTVSACAGSKRGSALVQVVGCPAPMSLLHSTSVMSPQNKKRKSASVEPELSAEEAWKQQALPTNLSLLHETFVAVQTVYEVLRHRNKRATYENLKPGVEASTGRRFLVSHREYHAASQNQP